eukprot:c10311_g1_i1.p1 GENE.c10311_g1_i1~~c10311_g1_i1.p1  ORF type:complete len:105 (-),score=20.82 c10311_g1_i1:10-324(-)
MDISRMFFPPIDGLPTYTINCEPMTIQQLKWQGFHFLEKLRNKKTSLVPRKVRDFASTMAATGVATRKSMRSRFAPTGTRSTSVALQGQLFLLHHSLERLGWTS